jgi:uncharacterized repeat protein (TIGR01451 family)
MKYRLQRSTALFSLITLLLASLLPNNQSEVLAQIDNNQPNQPFASIVDCIRSGADLGVDPERSPRFVTSCYRTKITMGGYATRSDAFDAYPTDSSIISFGDAKLDGTGDLANHSSHDTMATIGDVGSIYGLAYSSGTNPLAPASTQISRVFAGAHNKMQTRFGSGGPGAIYQVDPFLSTSILYVTVPNVVPGPLGQQYEPGDGSATVFPNTGHEPNYTHESGGLHTQNADSLARDLAGKVSLGDVTLDPQERYLYTVNLNNKRVYRFDTWSLSPQSTMTILPAPPSFSNPSACNVSGNSGPQDLRPFALNVTNSSVYLGTVCTAESSQDRRDLSAAVMRFDLATNAWAAHATAFGLREFDTQRGSDRLWRPWQPGNTPSLFFSTPLLSDIEFDENRNMILGFRDRSGDMNSQAPFSLPLRAEGDLLYLELNTATSTWGAPSSTTEHFIDTSGVNSHIEAAGGGIAYLPGDHDGSYGGEVVSTFVDPYRNESFGAAWWDVSGGSWTAREELYQGGLANHTFGKASGLGDIELLCSWASIGDRVWRDSNGNGIQDAGEPDISGVRLQIFLASDTSYTNPLGTVTTGSVADMSGNWRFYVNPFESYRIRIDPTMFNTGQPLAGLRPTLANATHDAQDSDADQNGVIVTQPVGDAQVDITYDFGLASQTNVFITKTGTTSVVVGSNISYALGYGNNGPIAAANVNIVDTLPVGVSFVSASPAPTSVSGQTLTWNLGNVAAGASGTITINATATPSAANSVTNNVTISTTTTETSTSDNSATHVTVITRPDVHVTKTGTATAPVGSSLSYTLNYGNSGNGTAANVSIVDTLPAGVSFVSASPAPASVSGQTLTWNLGNVAAGATGTITINTTVTSSAANSVTNNVTISTTTTEITTSNNTSTFTSTVPRPNVYTSKTGPTTATVGSSFSYSVSYGNNGNSVAAGVVLVDTLPAGVSFVSASPAPTSVSGQTLTWNLGNVAAGATGTISINVQSSATLANGAVVVNNVAISTTSGGDNPNDNSGSSTTTLQRADVTISKSSPTTFPVLSGQTVTYYLDYGNNGPAAAANVVLVDTVPSQLTSVTWRCTSGCSGSGTSNSISINLGTLAAGATGRVTVTGIATTALDREDFTNTATISTSTPETSTSNNQSSVVGAVWTPDVQIIKLAEAQVIAGETFTATLRYANNGPATASAVVLTDTLPTGISLVSSLPVQSSLSGQTLTWNLGALTSGQSGVIELVLRADSALAHNSIVINHSAIQTSGPDRDLSNNSSSAQTVVLTEANLAITKAGPAVVVAGNQISYTITYSNTGPSVARSVIITDTLPAEVVFASAAPAASSQNGNLLSWAVGDLAAGTTGSITVLVDTDINQIVGSLLITNSVEIDSPTPDPDPDDNSDRTTTEAQTADVWVLKDAPVYVIAGVPFTYTLTYGNNGPATAQNVTVRDLLPTGLTVMSANPAATGPGMRWALPNLAPNVTGTITLQVMPATTAITGTTYTNVAVIDTTTPDRDPSNDTDNATSTVQLNADLSIVKTAPAGDHPSGSLITYTLTYTNAGPSQAQAVVLRDVLPDGFEFVNANPAPDSTSSTELQWTLGVVNAGASGSIAVTGRLYGSGVRTNRTNTAYINSPTPDPDPNNNTSTVTTPVLKPDLSITKDDGQTSVQPGDTLTYNLVVRNNGEITATAVVITDTLPAGLVPLDPVWVSIGSNSYTLAIGDLAPHQTVTRTMRIELPNPLPASLRTRIINTASVGDDGGHGPDPTPGDNSDRDENDPLFGSLGDFVWLDGDVDGRQDAGEQGLSGIVIQLLDSTGQVLAEVTTDSDGRYLFEGYRYGQYRVRLHPTTLLSGSYQSYVASTATQQASVLSATAPNDLARDFGLYQRNPTAVDLSYFIVEGTRIRWGTVQERDTTHFEIIRSSTKIRTDGVVIGQVASQGAKGGHYSFVDTNQPSGPAYYWLVEVERSGLRSYFGPVSLRTEQRVYLPFIAR